MKLYFLLCLFLCSTAVISDEVLLRFGAISDNHFDRTRPAMAERTKMAFELFRKHKVDFFVDCGDVADTYQPDMFRLWRQLYLEVFQDEKTRPDFLMIPAGHDRIGTSWQQGYSDFVKYTGSGSVNPVKKIKGFHFVSIAQNEDSKILKKNLAEAVAASGPQQTVFVITHYPPRNTTPGSFAASGGDLQYRKILDSCPQAVVISGHTHSRLMDERSIWQGNFTVVNAGSLAYTDNAGIANPSIRQYSYDASIWEVYKNKIIIRRFNVSNGNEIFPETPWTIPLPFDQKTAPYTIENRIKNFPVPEFKKTNQVVFQNKKMGWNRWGILEFPLPENNKALHRYRLILEKKNSTESTHYGIIEIIRSSLPEKAEKFAFSAGYLEKGDYHFSLTPISYFGKSGMSLQGEFSVKNIPWKEIKKDHKPVILSGKKDKTEVAADSNGFFNIQKDSRLLIPREIIEKTVEAKKKLIVSMDIECHSPGNPASLRIINEKGQIVTMSSGCFRETKQKQRYSFVFRPRKKIQDYSLLIRRGSPGKYKFSNIRYFLY